MTARLLTALDPVTVGADGTHATVGARELTADDPRELRRLLADALYEALHAGHAPGGGELPFRIRDFVLEQTLAGAVPHRRTPVRAPALPEERDDGILVELDGVRVTVPPDRVLDAHPDGTLTVAVAACRPALSPGFFLVDGSRRAGPGSAARGGAARGGAARGGAAQADAAQGRAAVLRVYVHLRDARAATAVWARALRHLEDQEAVYRAKVLSAEALYPRRDALVVYLPDGAEPGAEETARSLAWALRGMPGLLPDTSLFAERLAPGVATAWEPHDPRPGMRGLSFGQHRATAAAGALAARARGEGPLGELLAQAFREARIDPGRPARNLPAQD